MKDFRKSTVYQIYPKSFYDSNNDGLGDLRGAAEKLDYIKGLGVDYIWLTPFFISPQKDNGYDVEDYYNIDARYGTMDDFEYLVSEAHKRDIGLMLDMVFNHTSDRHQWFQKALSGDERYKKYYFFKKGRGPGIPPTNWESKFGGSAWEYVPEFDEYYLHLFDVSQPDLNWDNEEVRNEMAKIVRFWMAKGVKGFRFDVVNLISKSEFEDDMEGDGRRFYTDGPNIHKYLKELNMQSFGMNPEMVTVGEMSSTSLKNCFEYAGADSHELSMVFSFHHLKVDFMGNEKWVLVPFDFKKLKNIMFDWQVQMAQNDAWNAVFWCNHDQPRVVSRFGDEGIYREVSAKMLATVIHCLRGTPYIFQGEEIGMTNPGFTDITQYKDVESLNHFRILQEKGLSQQHAYDILSVHSRDNGRTPMQWESGKNGGFTQGEPWIEVNKNCVNINAEDAVSNPESIYHHYRKLADMRKKYDVIAYGDVVPVEPEHTHIFSYERNYKNEQLFVVNNFYKTPLTWDCKKNLDMYEILISNYENISAEGDHRSIINLRPYESIVFYRKK